MTAAPPPYSQFRRDLMKLAALAIVAAAVVSSVGLTGCLSNRLSEASQDKLTAALVDKIAHCSGTVQINAGLGGLAGAGTGIANNAQLTCVGQPYASDTSAEASKP